MKKFLKKKLGNEKGMTLIELLAVIVILAIIAAIAIPAIGNIIQNSRNGAVKADFQQAIAAANLYVTEEGALPTSTGTGAHLIDLASYLEDSGSLTTVTISRVGGDLAIVGEADRDKDGTVDYKITSAMTNAELSKYTNEEFTGLTLAPKTTP